MNNNGFKLDFGSDKDRWEQFLDEIDEGDVIPVIGPDLLVNPKIIKLEDNSERKENLHQQLISYIASQTNVQSCPRTFSQLVYDESYKKMVRDERKIYNLIHQILSNIDQIDDIDSKPSQLLMDLLSTKKFPFVITTSFTPIVENAMREIWGTVNVLNFNNDPQGSSQEKGGDIKSPNDMKQPTVYYMFGKYCNNSKDTRFVVTDSDMMKFCSSWIKGDGVPKNLTESMKKKYLLILGNNYSDWLFRFVWYGLRSTTNDMKSDVIVNDSAEDSFKQFLERLETFFQEDPAEVIKRIKEEIEARALTMTLQSSYDTDAFISYSHADKSVAKKLYDRLTSSGFKIWFDDNSIKKAADWESSIEAGIKRTRLFIPILSKNVEQESIIPHEYRTEWNIAASISSKMGGRTFIVPFVEKDFDFYNPLTKLPKEFSKKNATWYTEELDLDEITNVVTQAISNLKDLEKRMKS